MSEHDCIWETSEEWQSDDNQAGWKTAHLRRWKQCSICNQSLPIKDLNRRRREKLTIEKDMPVPAEVRKLPSQRWILIEKLLITLGGNRLELEAKLKDWLAAGWVQIEEGKEPYRDVWQVEKVRLAEAVYRGEIETPRIKRGAEKRQEILETLQVLNGWEKDYERARLQWASTTEQYNLAQKLAILLEEQNHALKNGTWQPIPQTTQRPGSPLHQRWVRILRGLIARMATHEWEYERGFSARWLGDSKEFTRDRRDICEYLQISLEELGLYRHSPVVYCWGPFRARLNQQEIYGKAGVPFIALTAETVRFMEIGEVSAARVLVVENQTAFEYLLRTRQTEDNSLYLYSGGHAGFGEREWLKKILLAQPGIPWFLWTDWDYGGTRIHMDWEHWALRETLSAPYSWLSTREFSTRWKRLGKEFSKDELEKIQKLAHPFSAFLQEVGYSLEQEAMLQDFPDVFDFIV